MNNNMNFARSTLPMTPENYNMQLTKNIQDMTLRNDAELQEITRHQRNMEREALRSKIRQAEFAKRQAMKCKNSRVFVDGNKVVLQTLNGENRLIGEWEMFLCRILEVKRFSRSDNEDYQWQIILEEEKSGNKIESELYDYEFLRMPSKLQQTILTRYDVTVNSNVKLLAWQWVRKELISMYENAPVFQLPSKAGWFKSENSWHFWTSSDTEILLLNDQIKKFSFERIHELNTEETVKSFICDVVKISNSEYMGILLIFNLLALLGRLVTKIPVGISITIVGKRAESVAKSFLCTMQSAVDIVNLDSDRMNVIRNRIKDLQDTPAIFISSNPDSKSTQNRIEEINGWLNSGYIEGTKVLIPFVFCLKKFSKTYPLDNSIVLNADKVAILSDDKSFIKFQNLIISIIEDSGDYWVDELIKAFKTADKTAQNNDFLSLVQAMVRTIIRMLNANDFSNDVKADLQDLFRSGEQEIYRQLFCSYGVLIEIFRESVIELVSCASLIVANKDRAPLELTHSIIYYDADYYYFTKKVFEFICQQAEIDEKSFLFVKQQLINQGFVKLYRSGNDHRDFYVDFFTYNPYGKREKRSALAIKREFWDESGGVELWERGDGYADFM